MTPQLSEGLIALFMCDRLPQVFELSLALFAQVLRPSAAVLLVWDFELKRYIVGSTWVSAENAGYEAEFRRSMLQTAEHAHREDPMTVRCLSERVLYQPLNMDQQHIAAVLCEAEQGIQVPQNADYQQLVSCAARALYTQARLQQADQDRANLEAEHLRLEDLLRAVEQQQRTIDRLLVIERQFSASLEVKVEERTQALRLAQQRLLQSEKLAVIGKLASSLAHELNNPLQAIQSGLGLVMDDLERGNHESVRADLRVINAELERIESIFAQMLDFYRPVSHHFEPLDLEAICEAIHVLMRKRLQQQQVTLHLTSRLSTGQACGDSNQIKQVLINLILNAADAMTEQGGNIWLEIMSDEKELRVYVTDDGPGIAPEHLQQLFEPLFTTKPRGLGLGLAISQEIAQRHEGRLEVNNQVAGCTVFTLCLPIRRTCNDKRETHGR